jgi:hypothetical protein
MPMSPMPMTTAEIHLHLLVTIGSICLAFSAASPYVSAQANPMFKQVKKQMEQEEQLRHRFHELTVQMRM